jgi:hypothetical protein
LKRLALLSCAALASFTLLTQAANAGVVTRGHVNNLNDRSHWKLEFRTVPPQNVNFATLADQARANKTLPFFSNTIKSPLNGQTYSYSLVGTDPTKSLTSTTVKYRPIALRFHFPNGVVLDPTQPGCGDTVAVDTRFFTGPLFVNDPLTSNGINVGNTQYEDAFMRAEFWEEAGSSGNYHVLLKKAKPSMKVLVVDETAPSGSTAVTGGCAGSNHDLGEIPYGAYVGLIQTVSNKYAKPGELPIMLAYNVVQTSGGCCIIGFHGAYGRTGGTQVYATGSYTDPGEFGAIQDIYAWTHEIGEAFNDPFVNNATPAWGHVGQVSGCQNNLEVGDPLTGTPAVTVPLNGFTYHGQELAFFDWFYRTPSQGTGGKFSFEGTFTSSQGTCT